MADPIKDKEDVQLLPSITPDQGKPLTTPEVAPSEATPPPPSTANRIAKTAGRIINLPARGYAGLGVLAATGDIQRAAEATKPGFEPEGTKEAVAHGVGFGIGLVPMFVAAAKLAAPAIAAAGLKGVAAQAASFGVASAASGVPQQLEEKGAVSPKDTLIDAAIGAAIPPALAANAKLLSTGLKSVARTTIQPEVALMRNVLELGLMPSKKMAAIPVKQAAAAKAMLEAVKDDASEPFFGLGTPVVKRMLDAAKGVEKAVTDSSAFVQEVIKKQFNKPISQAGARVADLAQDRAGSMAEGLLNSQYFVHQVNKGLTEAERKVLPFLIENKVPKEMLATLPEGKITPAMRQWAKTVKDYFDEGFSFLRDNYDLQSYTKNYVPHLWDVPKSGMGGYGKLLTSNPFAKERSIPSFADGIEAGLKPKTTDISELIQIYDNFKIKAVANKKFLTELKGFTDEAGQKLIQASSDAPADWPIIDHPSLRRLMAAPTKEGDLIFKEVPVRVHPEIKKAVESVLSNPFSGKWVRNLEVLKATIKKVQLSFSLFHHVALSESMFASQGTKEAVKSLRGIYKQFKAGTPPIFDNMPLSRDAVRHGLGVGAMPEMFLGRLQAALKGAEQATKNIPGVAQATKGLRSFNDLWDKAMWDYLHTGMKLTTYEQHLAQNLAKHKDMPIKEVKRQTAAYVNDAFGGQNWEALLVNPKMKQAMNWVLLAPDWTISNIRIFGRAFQNGIGGEQGRKYWLRAGLYMFAFSNLLNYANTKKHLGEGRWMHENEPDRRTRIFAGKDENGANIYIRQGKQFREPMEFLMDPLVTFGNKLSPIIREAIHQQTGVSTGGFPSKFKDEPFWSKEGLKERGKAIVSQVKPFSFSDSNYGFALPKSKGMTRYRTAQLFMEAVDKGDEKKIEMVMKFAKENNIEAPEKLLGFAKAEVTKKRARAGKEPRPELESDRQKAAEKEAKKAARAAKKKKAGE